MEILEEEARSETGASEGRDAQQCETVQEDE